MFILDMNHTLENIIIENKEVFPYINDINQPAILSDFDVSFKNPSSLADLSRTNFNFFLFDIRENQALRNSDTGIAQ